jgi:predicted nucleic acid-binding protein
MARLVLTDASPLIGLARVDGLGWLEPLFGVVWVPPPVRDEVLPGLGHKDEEVIRAGLDEGWLKVHTAVPKAPALPDLDVGEAACIRIGLAQTEPCLVLMDERAGRAIAAEHGLRVAGTAAVIGLARQRGLIPSARGVFAALHASDFRISPTVIRTVLQRLGE